MTAALPAPVAFARHARSMLLAVPLLLATARPGLALVLFDAHLHYTADAAARYPPVRVIDILAAGGVARAVVTSVPPRRVLALHAAAPELIVPMLGVYRSPTDKTTWTQDADLPARLARLLREGPWRGIGELHLFARQRHSPVFLRIVKLAAAHDLPLLLHCDPAVIDTLYEHRPDTRVVWAHAGAYPYPDLLRDYLERYPRLSIDLSMRDGRIAPAGELDPGWERLLWEYPDRFMVGVDTFSAGRWARYADAVARIRHWLEQLPEAVAAQISYRNAARVYTVPAPGDPVPAGAGGRGP